MANETKSQQQSGTSGQAQQGHRQQQAEHRSSGQQGGTTGSTHTQQVPVGSQNTGGAVQQRGRRELARYGRDPFSIMQQMSDEMDELFDAFFYGRPTVRRGRQSELQQLWSPEIEMKEEKDRLRISVDLPGISKDNVKVDIKDGMLTLQGERTEEHTEGSEKEGFHRSERRYGSFYRTVPLPEGANAEAAQANMKDGVLEISIPFAPRKQGKRLEIK